jgi:hypothetical protein
LILIKQRRSPRLDKARTRHRVALSYLKVIEADADWMTRRDA